jgi:chromosome segregation protein
LFLKRLELSGFKSFADRTELEFVTGITGVVGPNGSGKSNISDSIRWVLGEQSAKSLRGGNMQDIIFAGSDTRKAVNYADVSLTLDNADHALSLDFSEVTVTRRLHRSGESEYFINKQACRLKDITELFMDTGIGREAYSIIGQGRIDEILSSRSEDRRGIFEEASGIVKFKSRKREAQKRLEETEQNLLRIHDLTTELEDQLEPLAAQSEKAKTYKQLKDHLKSIEISLYVHHITELYKSWTEAKAALESLKNEELTLLVIVSAHDANLEVNRLAMRKLEEEIEALQRQLLSTIEELEKKISAGEVIKERRKNGEENLHSLQLSKQAMDHKIAERNQEANDVARRIDQLSVALETLHAAILEEDQRLSNGLDHANSATEDQLKNELLDIRNGLASSRNELKYMGVQAEQNERRMYKLEEEKDKSTGHITELETQHIQSSGALAMLKQEIDLERNRFIEIGQHIHEQQSYLEEALSTVRKWEQKIESLRSRKLTIQELQDDYDGFAQGVREVMKAHQKQTLHGIHGTVAETIRVPGEFEVAIETALGASLQHIIADNETSAREAIQYLHSRQLGRATLLPLNIMKPRLIPEVEQRHIVGLAGFRGIAADLIKYEQKYSAIVGNLLGNVVIADTLEQANRIAAKLQYRYRIVTPDGDIINTGGSMTGGSLQKKNVSLLGRQRQIEQLTHEMVSAESQVSQLRDHTQSIRSKLAESQRQLERCREAGENKRRQETESRAVLNRVETELNQFRDKLLLIESEFIELTQQRDQESQQRDEIYSRITSLEETEQALIESIQAASLRRHEAQSAKEEQQQQLTNWKVSAAATTQDKQALTDQLVRNQAERDILEQERSVIVSSIERLMEELSLFEKEASSFVEQVNELRIVKNRTSELLDFKRAERTQSQQALDREESATREERTRLRWIEEQAKQTEIRLNRLDVELENLLHKLAEEYEMSYELAKERYEIPRDVPATQAEVRENKRKISALGDVNLGAIEEYERITERFEFLTGQKNDLIEAKTKLYGVIKEIEQEMSKRFLQSFESIREQFADVFKRLFGGGRADMILSDPTNLLETGIEIIAQPPGKKQQNLQLLSGGERALTAIAILFAILRVKPVPFCVLDEVEAALDEANVIRFAQYLREFSMDTQFIVVTHRKGTMEEADVLYGVTMEEGGVSKLVSVRLDQDEEPLTA